MSIVASVLAFVVACMVVDVRTRRIPNALSGTAIIAGAILNACLFGTSGLLHSASGLVLSIAVLLAPFALGGIGGGDVKMMGAVGAFLGPGLTLGALGCGLMFGGAVMVAHLARVGRLREKLAATWTMVSAAIRTGSARPLRVSAADPAAVALPYSVPLGFGTIVVIALASVLRAVP